MMIDVLGEATAVDPDYNPRIGQQSVGLLKEAHVFVPGVRQRMSDRFMRRRKLPHQQERSTYLELAMVVFTFTRHVLWSRSATQRQVQRARKSRRVADSTATTGQTATLCF